MTIWFTADQHFDHTNIIKYCNRPFANKDEMNDAIIDRHNEVVSKSDDVYVIGDFTLRSNAQPFIDRLNGNLYMIEGSHDHNWFEKAYGVEYLPPLYSLELRGPYRRYGYPLVIVLCHYAMRRWDRSHHGSLHLYGHSHGRITDPLEHSMDVGVDCHNFYPVSLEQVLAQIGT